VRRFLDGETRKKAQLDNAFLIAIELREPAEGLIDGQHIDDAGLVRSNAYAPEGHECLAAAALLCLARSRVVDQDAAHDLGDHAIELRAVLPVGAALIDEPQVHFVDQCGRIQRVLAALSAQASCGHTPALIVDERKDAFERVPIAL
jgi:hypothetical protein